eukprot:100441_1
MQSLASDEIICGILSPTMILDKNDNIDRDEYIIPTFGIYTTANILFIISTSGEEKVVALTGDREDKMVLILLVHDENTDELIKDELIYDKIIKDEIMNDMSLNSLLRNERGREYNKGEELKDMVRDGNVCVEKLDDLFYDDEEELVIKDLLVPTFTTVCNLSYYYGLGYQQQQLVFKLLVILMILLAYGGNLDELIKEERKEKVSLMMIILITYEENFNELIQDELIQDELVNQDENDDMGVDEYLFKDISYEEYLYGEALENELADGQIFTQKVVVIKDMDELVYDQLINNNHEAITILVNIYLLNLTVIATSEGNKSGNDLFGVMLIMMLLGILFGGIICGIVAPLIIWDRNYNIDRNEYNMCYAISSEGTVNKNIFSDVFALAIISLVVEKIRYTTTHTTSIATYISLTIVMMTYTPSIVIQEELIDLGENSVRPGVSKTLGKVKGEREGVRKFVAVLYDISD